MDHTFDEDDSAARAAAERLRGAERLLVLTGAGISAESGVPTFRGDQGLWRTFRPEQLATPEAFGQDPQLVWEWYEWRRSLVAKLRPNAGHASLAAYEARRPGTVLVTQNVDGLHALAGSPRPVEVHGSLWRTRCTSCRRIEDARVPFPVLPPSCACGGTLRPDVVWFGESLDPEVLELAFGAAGRADVVLVVGTSALVYPAAALPFAARSGGAFVIEVNPEATPLTPEADISLRATSAGSLPFLLGDTAS